MAAEDGMLRGGCFCGRVRYEAEGAPFHETICHCTDCRRAVGAVAVAWFSVDRGGLRWSGEAATLRSSPGVVRRFCPDCGTSLTFEDERHPDEIDLTVASLDEPDRVAPRDHVFAGSKPAWEVLGDGLPAYARRRTDGERV
jgi:hypothetical protein